MSLFQREFLSCQFSHYENCLAKNYNYFILKTKIETKDLKLFIILRYTIIYYIFFVFMNLEN